MSRRATDRLKQFHLMSATLSPAPDLAGDVSVPAGTPTFSVVVIDPDNAPPYTYLWEQQPVADPTALLGTPAAASTPFGPLLIGHVYYLRVTVKNAQETKFVKSMRVFAT